MCSHIGQWTLIYIIQYFSITIIIIIIIIIIRDNVTSLHEFYIIET